MPAGELASVIGSGLGTVFGTGMAIYGASQAKKDQQTLNNMSANRPVYNIPQGVLDNQRLAESQAGQGMSDASRTAYMNQANNGLAAGLSALEKSGDTSGVGNLYGAYDEGIGKQALYDDQARMAHLATYMNQNQNVANYGDKAWQINKYAPWADSMQRISQQLQGARNMEMSGINTGMSGLMGLGKGVSSMFGGDGASQQPTNTPTQSGATNPWSSQNPYMGSNGSYNFYNPVQRTPVFTTNDITDSPRQPLSPQYPTSDQAISLF